MTDEDKIFSQIDADKIKEEVKNEAIKAAQDALISKLQGDKPKYSWEQRGKEAPSNYDELFDEVKKQTPTLSQDEIDKRVDEKLAQRESEKVKQEEDNKKKQLESLEQTRKQFDQDWYELVKEKKMPAPSPEVQEKINKGERLTREEILADEGLKARLELADLAKTKSAKLAFYEDYNKEPAGAKAPVLGGRPSASQSDSKELEYDDIKENRKKIFGW